MGHSVSNEHINPTSSLTITTLLFTHLSVQVVMCLDENNISVNDTRSTYKNLALHSPPI